MIWLWCVPLMAVGFSRCSSQECNPQQYDTCANRFLERDFIVFEELLKSYPGGKRRGLGATDIELLCSGFQELLACYITQYANCDAPDTEQEKIIRAAVHTFKLLCNSDDRTLIQTGLRNVHCYLDADAKCRSSNVTVFTWKEIFRFERLRDRQATCNALIDHGRCLLSEYNSLRCSNSPGRNALDTTIKGWGRTYCSGAGTAHKYSDLFVLLLLLIVRSFATP